MNEQTMLILIAVSAAVVIITTILIIKNTRKSELKKKLNSFYVRFNALKSIPITYKLNKAKLMSRQDKDLSAVIEATFDRYVKCEKQISLIQDLLNNAEDSLGVSSYKESKNSLEELEKEIVSCETEVDEIDSYLEEFSKKENKQREYATNLKEKYRVVKNTINENSNLMSIAYDGLVNKLKECEDLFSTSDEYIYNSEYEKAQEDLNKIDEILDTIKVNANAIPKCVKNTKGVIPLLLDEAKREYSLTKQRGVYVDTVDIDAKLEKIENNLNEDVTKLLRADTEGVKEHCHEAKKILNELIDYLSEENKSYKQAKAACDKAHEHVEELIKVESYVRNAYEDDSERFDLEDLKPMLDEQLSKIEEYKQLEADLLEGLNSASKPASEILLLAETMCENIDEDSKKLYSYKTVVDKTSDGEQRASSQLMKLQLVVCEVEAKIAQYKLPNISNSYVEDLHKSREYISQLRNCISEIPINIEVLNIVLDEAIDFIYKFYNNVNNVVGMAIMVENAIVFGNKYRSTYYEIDRELSKAEFQYLNGEYTKALKTAISCMETLFPDNADKKIMENA